VGLKSVAALGIFELVFDFQHCQSRDCLCLLEPINTLQRQYTENSKQIFPEMKLRRLNPNSYNHVSVSNLYIPTIVLPILLQEYRGADLGNI
jgi:hypothetical protein